MTIGFTPLEHFLVYAAGGIDAIQTLCAVTGRDRFIFSALGVVGSGADDEADARGSPGTAQDAARPRGAASSAICDEWLDEGPGARASPRGRLSGRSARLLSPWRLGRCGATHRRRLQGRARAGRVRFHGHRAVAGFDCRSARRSGQVRECSGGEGHCGDCPVTGGQRLHDFRARCVSGIDVAVRSESRRPR